MRALKLTRYFSLVSLLLLMLAGSLLGVLIRGQEVAQMERLAVDRNVVMTQVLGNFLRDDIERLIADSAGRPAPALQTSPNVARLHEKIRQLISGSDIAKVKIYNRQGLTVFSTEAAQIGEGKGGNAGFRGALAGEVLSELTHRQQFSATEGSLSDVDLLSSYVPVRENGQVVAVFELYQDVTRLLGHIDRSLWQIAVIVVAVFGVLYLLLVGVVRRAQVALTLQEARLEALNRELDQRVENRTLALTQSEALLRESEARFRSLTEMSSDFYWETDAQHRFTARTRSAREAADSLLCQADFLGQLHWEVPHIAPDEAGWLAHRAVLEAHLPFRDFEISRQGAQGQVIVSVSGDPVFDATGAFVGYRGVGADITGRKLAEERIRTLAFFDPLTGLPNRTLLLERLRNAAANNAGDGGFGAVLVLDIDHFKSLNDTRGHACGDILLGQVAQRLCDSVRQADTVARLGGDEYVVMLARVDGDTLEAATPNVEALSQKLLGALKQAYNLDGADFHCSASIGMALFGGAAVSVDDALRQADIAMYQAKRHGGNKAVFFDVGMESAALEYARLERELRVAIDSGQLELFYQPQVDGRSSKILGAEALVRWNHPQRGRVPPNEFIPHAERTGLILPLGQWVLQAACECLAEWGKKSDLTQLTLAVNVSAQQFKMHDFAEQVSATLRHTGANPQRLKLELTESIFAGNIDEIVTMMEQLKTLGVGFSLDDFGTGYSSLAYLSRLPLDQLKIDKSFVANLESDDTNVAICAATISLAHSLRLKVVAEGVETSAQRYFLSTVHRCDVLQGYLFGRPLPRQDFEQQVASEGLT